MLPVWHLVFGTIGLVLLLGGGLGVMLFRSGKSRQERTADVALIALTQLIALGCGGLLMAQAAPIRMVWAVDHFDVVSPMEMRHAGRPYSVAQQLSLAWSGLRVRQLTLPADMRARQALLFSELDGQSLSVRDELQGTYQPQSVQSHVRPVTEVSAHGSVALQQSSIDGQSCAKDDVGWVPMKSRRGFHTALVSRKDGRICGVVDLDLWDK